MGQVYVRYEDLEGKDIRIAIRLHALDHGCLKLLR